MSARPVEAETPASARDALRALVAQPSVDGTRLYWLLDQSALPPRGWMGRQVGKAAWSDLLSGSSETRFNGASPLLVSADGRSTETNLRLADELYRVGRYANAIALIVTRLGLDDLQATLRPRTRVRLPGNLEAVLRYFDTRTLPVLPRLCTPVQYAAFVRDIACWSYLDRRGSLRQMPPAAVDGGWPAASMGAPLELDDAQEASLIDDGLTDAVIDFFLTQGHPALRGLTPPEQFDLIDPLVTAARSAGLLEYVEAIGFVDRALVEGADLAGREPWRGRLVAYRQKRCSVEEVFA